MSLKEMFELMTEDDGYDAICVIVGSLTGILGIYLMAVIFG